MTTSASSIQYYLHFLFFFNVTYCISAGEPVLVTFT